MIVQELIKIQERLGWLPQEELRDLSRRLHVPLRRIHEVASFYPHYRLQPPPAVDVKVCRDMSCHLRGSTRLKSSLAAYANELDSEKICVGGVSCLGQCDFAPNVVAINDHVYRNITEAAIRQRIEAALAKQPLPHQHPDRSPQGWKIDVYDGKPSYEAVKRFLKDRNAQGVIDALKVADLRGMGGAGFRTHLKWSAVRAEKSDDKYVVCNADECEPGTFKDRELLRRTPWLTIEGMILGALVVGARQGWIYLRHEYHEEMDVTREAIAAAYEMGALGKNIFGSGLGFDLELFISPGGYVQGEETALLEAMEDRRGEPRNKPPFPTVSGLRAKPTVINNVETLAWVPSIVLKGGEWYRDGGIRGATGLRFVSISGDVAKPGVYEVPFGQTVKELVFDTAGGMREGQKLKAIAPSGPSGGFLPAFIPAAKLPNKFVQENLPAGAKGLDLLELPLDLNTVGKMGGMLGAAFVAYGDRCDLVEQALNCVEFYRNESCGKCVPCRLGSQKLTDIIKDMLARRFNKAYLPLVNDLSQTMGITSICGLGQVAANPIASVIKFFPEEMAKYGL
jgi:NADH:ubiquinone oxidoreductase subunit F (NADH-binding)/NADH:ubiquinone oxidoreductase subunit E